MNVKPYKPGDRIYYRNTYGQDFYATIIRTHDRWLIVKREEWFAEECIDLDDYVRSRHFPKTNEPSPGFFATEGKEDSHEINGQVQPDQPG